MHALVCSRVWKPHSLRESDDDPSVRTGHFWIGPPQSRTSCWVNSNHYVHVLKWRFIYIYIYIHLGLPVVPSYPFLREGSPTKIDYRKKGDTLILASLLEDLDIYSGCIFMNFWQWASGVAAARLAPQHGGLHRGAAGVQGASPNTTHHPPKHTGVMILTVSGSYQSRKMGLFPFNPPLNGG